MSDAQWTAVCLLLSSCWKGDFDQAKADAYRVMLGDQDADKLLGALRRLAHNGVPWLPTVPEILVEMEPSAPSWGEAYGLIFTALRKRTEAETLDELESWPVLQAFVVTQGRDRLNQLPVDDPQFGELERRRLGEAFDDFSERFRRRELEGRPVAVLPRGSNVRRLNPLKALEGGGK